MMVGVARTLAALAFVAAAGAAHGQAPSFDCAKAAAPDEVAICADAKLSELDGLMAEAYRQARAAPGKAQASRAAARKYLKQRSACKSSVDCIMRETAAVMGVYRGLGATVEVPPWANRPPAWAAGSAAPPAAGAAPAAPAPPAAPSPAGAVAQAAGQAAAALAPPALQQALGLAEPPNWIRACQVEQIVGAVWKIRIEESFGTIRVRLDYSALDRLKLRTRDGSQAQAIVAPYSYSASVSPSGSADAPQVQWLYEQVFLTVDPRNADVDRSTSIDIRIGDQIGPYRLGSPTPLDLKIAEELGRSVKEIALRSSEGEVIYPMNLQPYEEARRQMKLLVDEVAAKQLRGQCIG